MTLVSSPALRINIHTCFLPPIHAILQFRGSHDETLRIFVVSWSCKLQFVYLFLFFCDLYGAANSHESWLMATKANNGVLQRARRKAKVCDSWHYLLPGCGNRLSAADHGKHLYSTSRTHSHPCARRILFQLSSRIRLHHCENYLFDFSACGN